MEAEEETVDGSADRPVSAAPDGAEPLKGDALAKQDAFAKQIESAAENTATKEVANLSAALQGMRTENEELKEKNLRLLLEMESLRHRTDREKEEFTKYAISEFARDMLDVADNMRRAMEAVPRELLGAIPAVGNLVEGVEVTERTLLRALSRYRVTRFDPLGEPFNPHLHDAKTMANVPNVPANTVIHVIRAGYMIGERVLRHAAVIVAQGGRAADRPPKRGTSSVSDSLPRGTIKIPANAPSARDAEDDERAAARFRPSRSAAAGDEPGAQQQAGKLRHKPAILHKPVISATEGVPAATHPIWERLVTGQIKHRFKLFAANMLIDRAKREYADNRSSKARLASEICTFFNRYAKLTVADLEQIIAVIGGIPSANHPIWERLVTGQIEHRFKLFAANMIIDRAKREYANNRGAKTKLASELCKFFNGHADLTAAEFEMVASKETLWLN